MSSERKLFEDFCNSIQAAYVSYSALNYLQEQNRENWSDFEEELITCPKARDAIKSFNLYFSPDILERADGLDFIKDCFINPMNITDELVDDNLSLSGLYFLYCFAQLEYLGYEFLKRKVPDTTKEEHNWHKCIHTAAGETGFEKFKDVWSVESEDINYAVLMSFAKIKERRNEFAHKSGYKDRKLYADIQDIIRIGYYLYYLTTEDGEEFKIENYQENYEF